MVPDAEILTILCEALEALEIGEFTVKVSHTHTSLLSPATTDRPFRILSALDQ